MRWRSDDRVPIVVQSMRFRAADTSIPAPMPAGHPLPVETEALPRSLRHESEGRNLLLDALPTEDYERLRDRLEPVALPSGMPIYEANAPITHVYFVTSGIISMVTNMREGTVEVGVTGC